LTIATGAVPDLSAAAKARPLRSGMRIVSK
jgi:hypothetical protein